MDESADASKASGFQPKRALMVVAGSAALIGAIYFSGSQGTGAYTCDNLVPEIVKLSEENQNAILPVKLLDVVERKTASATDERIECSGVGILSNGLKASVKYRAYVEYGKWWILYEPVAVL